jgi:hypothetical protein
MSTGELHPDGRTACAYEGVNGVDLSIFRRLLLRLVLLFVRSPILALSRHLVSRFPLSPRHLLRIVVLTQYTLAIPSRSHENS